MNCHAGVPLAGLLCISVLPSRCAAHRPNPPCPPPVLAQVSMRNVLWPLMAAGVKGFKVGGCCSGRGASARPLWFVAVLSAARVSGACRRLHAQRYVRRTFDWHALAACVPGPAGHLTPCRTYPIVEPTHPSTLCSPTR